MTNRSEHSTVPRDIWSDWFLQSQVGFNVEHRAKVQRTIELIRDRVLDGARLESGTALLDVGTGYGLLAFGAIARIGPSLRVILTDISGPLLDRAREAASVNGIASQCQFIHAPADRIAEVDGDSMDVVTSRAVLTFAPEKLRAMQEWFRVLRPGGRLSIAEPIMQDASFELIALAQLIIAEPTLPEIEFLKLMYRWRSFQLPGTIEDIHRNPMTNCSERDLLQFAREAGFHQIHMELHMDVRQGEVTDWNMFLNATPHPYTQNLGRIMAEHFTESERLLFEKTLRPRVESGETLTSEATAYLTAEKPFHIN